MILNIRTFPFRKDGSTQHVPELGLSIKWGKGWYETNLAFNGTVEPLAVTFRGQAGVRQQRLHLEGEAVIALTARRMAILILSGVGSRGFKPSKQLHTALLTIDRDQFGEPRKMVKRKHLLTRVEVDSVDRSFDCWLYVKNPDRLVEVASAAYIDRLGAERAAELALERRGEQEAAAHVALEAAEAAKQAALDRFQRSASRPAMVSVPRSLNVFDHRKTWRYSVAAPPEACLRGFAQAFSGGGGVLLRANWEVSVEAGGAIATYLGRKGLVGLMTHISNASVNEEAGAVGSQVEFRIEAEDGGRTICAMWLATKATTFALTNDARFFRPYMRAVEAKLRQLDPSTQVVKD